MDNEKARQGGILVRNKKEQLTRARKIRGRLKTLPLFHFNFSKKTYDWNEKGKTQGTPEKKG